MTQGEKIKTMLRELASFTVRERRGILWFIPIIIVASVVVASLSKPRFDAGLRVAADMADMVDDTAFVRGHGGYTSRSARGYGGGYRNTSSPSGSRSEGRAVGYGAGLNENPAVKLFRFDPNTIDYRGLRALGFSSRAAAGILKFRESGKIFRIKEDFAACWDVGDSIFYVLEPYIVIDPQYAVRRNATASGMSAGSYSHAALTHPDSVSISPAAKKVVQKVELNSSDSTTLMSVRGIGRVTALRIIAYRASLGGFARVEQIAEIQGMNEENYERILQQIWVDDSRIQKIDINFALPEKLSGHPYISPEILRKLVKNRQMKGGWSTTESMVNDGTLTGKQAEKLAPYLMFNTNLNQ